MQCLSEIKYIGQGIESTNTKQRGQCVEYTQEIVFPKPSQTKDESNNYFQTMNYYMETNQDYLQILGQQAGIGVHPKSQGNWKTIYEALVMNKRVQFLSSFLSNGRLVTQYVQVWGTKLMYTAINMIRPNLTPSPSVSFDIRRHSLEIMKCSSNSQLMDQELSSSCLRGTSNMFYGWQLCASMLFGL